MRLLLWAAAKPNRQHLQAGHGTKLVDYMSVQAMHYQSSCMFCNITMHILVCLVACVRHRGKIKCLRMSYQTSRD